MALNLELDVLEAICIFWRNRVLAALVASVVSLVCVEFSWVHRQEFREAAFLKAKGSCSRVPFSLSVKVSAA